MTGLQLAMVVAHSLICVAIIALAMDLMRKRRNDGHPPDLLVWSYYVGAVGASLYLVEPLRGELPTLADLFFETAVLLYLVCRARERERPYMVRRR